MLIASYLKKAETLSRAKRCVTVNNVSGQKKRHIVYSHNAVLCGRLYELHHHLLPADSQLLFIPKLAVHRFSAPAIK